MTLADFYALLKTADASVKMYTGPGTGNYTVYLPYDTVTLEADNTTSESGWRIQVDRFTKLSNDPVVTAIALALAGDDDIACQYRIDYEQDTGYIHHIWTCEVV